MQICKMSQVIFVTEKSWAQVRIAEIRQYTSVTPNTGPFEISSYRKFPTKNIQQVAVVKVVFISGLGLYIINIRAFILPSQEGNEPSFIINCITCHYTHCELCESIKLDSYFSRIFVNIRNFMTSSPGNSQCVICRLMKNICKKVVVKNYYFMNLIVFDGFCL